MRKGIVFVISGPSGAGKGTVAKGLVDTLDNISFSISATNRAPRVGEVEGKSYYFVSDERFGEMIANGEFLEYVDKYKNKYGTPKSSVCDLIDRGVDVILDVETIGAANIKKVMPDAVSIINRGTESSDLVEIRFSQACDEIGCARDYDYIVVNDDRDKCLKSVASIIEAERQKGFRNEELPDLVLKGKVISD